MISEFRFSVPPSMGMGKPSTTSSPGLGSALPHLHWERALSAVPHLIRERAHPCHICARTGLPASAVDGDMSAGHEICYSHLACNTAVIIATEAHTFGSVQLSAW